MSPTKQIAVFRTGRSYEALMVLSELEAAGVPVYGQEENSGGLVTAMPSTPTQGPGVSWVIRVPEPAAEDAKQLIRELPVDAEQVPDVWHYGPNKRTKRVLQVFAAIFLVVLVASLVGDVLEWLSALLKQYGVKPR